MNGFLRAGHSDGSVHVIVNYNRGIPDGEHREYYPGGQQLARIFHYVGGTSMVFQDSIIQWPPCGKRLATKRVFKRKEDAMDADGKCLEEAEYVAGSLEGRYFQVGTGGEEVVFHYKTTSDMESSALLSRPSTYGRVKKIDAVLSE